MQVWKYAAWPPGFRRPSPLFPAGLQPLAPRMSIPQSLFIPYPESGRTYEEISSNMNRLKLRLQER